MPDDTRRLDATITDQARLAQRTLAMVALQHLGQRALTDGDDAFLAALSEAWVRAGMGLQWFASDVVYNASFDDAIARIGRARRGRHHAKLRHQADAILRTTNAMASLGDTARAAGVNVRDLSAFMIAVERMGGNPAAVEAAFKRIATMQSLAKIGQGGEELFQWAPLFGGNPLADSPTVMASKFAAELTKAQGNQQQTANLRLAGLNIFGEDITNAIMRQPQNWSRIINDAQRSAATPGQTQDFTKLQEAMRGLWTAVEANTRALIDKIAPGLADFLTALKKDVEHGLPTKEEIEKINPDLTRDVGGLWGWITGLLPSGVSDLITKGSPFGYTDDKGREIPGRSQGDHPLPGPRADTSANASDSYNFWVSKGLAPHQAAGMAAQEMAESQGRPGARGDYVNGVATAHGAYQWHSDRRARILAGTGIDVSNATIQQQREAAYWELTHVEHEAHRRLINARTPEEAGAAATEFERPDPNRRSIIDAERGRDAANILRRLNNPSGAPGFMPDWYKGLWRPLTREQLAPIPAGRYPAPPQAPSSSSNTTIGDVHINTPATDTSGIVRDVKRELANELTFQADRGLHP